MKCEFESINPRVMLNLMTDNAYLKMAQINFEHPSEMVQY